jgi:hypothetical protein
MTSLRASGPHLYDTLTPVRGICYVLFAVYTLDRRSKRFVANLFRCINCIDRVPDGITVVCCCFKRGVPRKGCMGSLAALARYPTAKVCAPGCIRVQMAHSGHSGLNQPEEACFANRAMTSKAVSVLRQPWRSPSARSILQLIKAAAWPHSFAFSLPLAAIS